MRTLMLVALCSAQAAAFSLAPSFSSMGLRVRSPIKGNGIAAPEASGGYRSQQGVVRAPAAAIFMSGASELDVKEYIKIFGRLSEKMLFGDASAGLCCHSACDDCEWRYSFDILQSARPKWIPTYRENKFEDGREHITKWSGLFEGEEALNKEQFCERLQGLKFEMPLGPAGYLTAKQAELPQEALDTFWDHMSRGKPTLSPKQMEIRLRKMLLDGSEGGGVMWSDFSDHLINTGSSDEDHVEEAIVVG